MSGNWHSIVTECHKYRIWILKHFSFNMCLVKVLHKIISPNLKTEIHPTNQFKVKFVNFDMAQTGLAIVDTVVFSIFQATTSYSLTTFLQVA